MNRHEEIKKKFGVLAIRLKNLEDLSSRVDRLSMDNDDETVVIISMYRSYLRGNVSRYILNRMSALLEKKEEQFKELIEIDKMIQNQIPNGDTIHSSLISEQLLANHNSETSIITSVYEDLTSIIHAFDDIIEQLSALIVLKRKQARGFHGIERLLQHEVSETLREKQILEEELILMDHSGEQEMEEKMFDSCSNNTPNTSLSKTDAIKIYSYDSSLDSHGPTPFEENSTAHTEPVKIVNDSMRTTVIHPCYQVDALDSQIEVDNFKNMSLNKELMDKNYSTHVMKNSRNSFGVSKSHRNRMNQNEDILSESNCHMKEASNTESVSRTNIKIDPRGVINLKNKSHSLTDDAKIHNCRVEDTSDPQSPAKRLMRYILNDKLSVGERKLRLNEYYENENSWCINHSEESKERLERIDILEQKFKNNLKNVADRISFHVSKEIFNLISEFNDGFALSDDLMPVAKDVQHENKLTTDKPISTPLHRHLLFMQSEIEKQIDTLKNEGVDH